MGDRQETDTRHTSGTMFGAVFLISTLAMVSSIPLKEMVCPQYTALDHPTFYPNPEDCGSYYMCDAGGTPVLMPCPSGLYWNSNLNVCDWPSNVECEESGESSSSEECGREPLTASWTHPHHHPHPQRRERERINWSWLSGSSERGLSDY